MTRSEDSAVRSATGLFGAVYRRPTLGIVVVLSLVAFEAFAVMTALPTALDELHGVRYYGLAFGVYLAASLFASVMSGGIADRSGPAPPFLAGAVLFASGALAVGTASSAVVFLIGRTLQGLGAGLMVVVLYVLVVRRYPEDLRPRVFAVMASAWVLPSVAGPPLAAFVTQQVGWRWIFLSIPVLLIAAVMALAGEFRKARLTNGDADKPQKFGVLSGYAAGTAAGGTLLQYAVQSGSRLITATGIVVATILLAISVPPLLPAGTLRARPGTPVFVLLRGLMAGAFFGTEVLFPLLVASRPGGNPTVGGLLLAAGSVGWASGSWLQGRLARREPARLLLVASCLLMTVGILITMTALPARTPLAIAGVGWCIAGIGMGAGLATVNRYALESSAAARHGTTSSALQVSDALASIVMTGIGAAVVTSSTPTSSPGRFAMVLAATGSIALVAAAVAFRRTGGEEGEIRNASSTPPD